MKQQESIEQIKVIQYCDLRKIPVFHIPNGGSRNKLEAANLKRQGVRAGVPDLFFPEPHWGYHGLFIEMKAGKNRATQKQTEWLKRLEGNGYIARVCRGFEDARALIEWYFSDKQNQCESYHVERGTSVCYGTQEKDECSCYGDEKRCNFYPEKRKGQGI